MAHGVLVFLEMMIHAPHTMLGFALIQIMLALMSFTYGFIGNHKNAPDHS